MSVEALCKAVMKGVVSSGALRAGADLDRVIQVMREEVEAFFTSPKYEDARDCVMRRSLHDSAIIALIVANCVSRIV